jgi:hypothetical protein
MKKFIIKKKPIKKKLLFLNKNIKVKNFDIKPIIGGIPANDNNVIIKIKNIELTLFNIFSSFNVLTFCVLKIKKIAKISNNNNIYVKIFKVNNVKFKLKIFILNQFNILINMNRSLFQL